MYKRILLPLDGSALAERALPHAVAQAERLDAELIILRVLEPLSETLGQSTLSIQRAEELTPEMARNYLERIAARVREDGIQARVEIIEGGRPYHEIIEYAQTNEVDQIVICTRGRSGFSRWAMGSVADREVRGADVPVLLVRAIKRTVPDDEGPA